MGVELGFIISSSFHNFDFGLEVPIFFFSSECPSRLSMSHILCSIVKFMKPLCAVVKFLFV